MEYVIDAGENKTLCESVFGMSNFWVFIQQVVVVS